MFNKLSISPRYFATGLLFAFLISTSVTYAEYASVDSRNTQPAVNNTYDRMGNTFAQATKARDIPTMAEMFDMEAFANIAARTVYESSKKIEQFSSGILRHKEEAFLTQIFNNVFKENADVKFLRVLKGKNPLIRIDYPEGGHEYVILYTQLKNDKKLTIVDMLFLSNGKKLSVSLGAASQLLLRPSKSVLKKLFGTKEVDKELLESFKELSRLRRSNKNKEAYHLIESFPDNIKNQRVIIDLSVQLAQLINDDEYRKQLSRLDKFYGTEETTTFILIDHYYYTGEYSKAISAINRIINLYGEDGALYNLLANTYHYAKDNTQAENYSRKAISTEPSFEDPYWTLVTIQLSELKHRDVVRTLDTIEQKFGYKFAAENFQGNDVYKDFIKSPEFNARFK